MGTRACHFLTVSFSMVSYRQSLLRSYLFLSLSVVQVSVEVYLDLDCPFSKKMFKVLYEAIFHAFEGKVSKQ